MQEWATSVGKTKQSKSADKFYSDDEEEKEEEGSESSGSEDSSSSSSSEGLWLQNVNILYLKAFAKKKANINDLI